MIALHLGIIAYGAEPWPVHALIATAQAGDAQGLARLVNARRVGLFVELVNVCGAMRLPASAG